MAREILQNQVYGANSNNFTGKSTTDVTIISGAAIDIKQTVQKKLENGHYEEFTLDGIGYFTSNDEFRYVIKVTSEIDDTIRDIRIMDAVPSGLKFEQSEITCKTINIDDPNETSDVEITFETLKPDENEVDKYCKTVIDIVQMKQGQYLEIYIPVTVPVSTTPRPVFGSSIVTPEIISTEND